MTAIFADTYYFLAIENEQDDGHQRAVQFSESYDGEIITTDWVPTEVADAFASQARRKQFVRLFELVSDDTRSIIVEASRELFLRGIALFSQRPDKDWSLTDCISFVVMRDHGLTDALTADHHFEQAGFVSLLK